VADTVRARPVAATLAGEQFVAFRDGAGAIAVFVDRCPHRGMQLSHGRVVDGRLTCPYHGWRFDARGCGDSPGNRSLRPRANRVEAVEQGGIVWVRRGGEAEEGAPETDAPGFRLVHRAFRDIDAPMLAVLDNFTEIEHTGAGHWEFGFSQERMHEVSFKVTDGSDRAAAIASGPQKRLSLPSRLALGVAGGDRLTVTIDVDYAPLRVAYEWWWEDADTGAAKGCRFREIAFFASLGPRRARLLAYYYWTMSDGGRLGANWLVRAMAARVIRYEIGLDERLCTDLTPGAESLRDCHLTRFDALLPIHRRNLVGAARPDIAHVA
jgi:phenylpropionate dioxygenase-like ring-hydroxylating dioxygenase large terminal subunit